MSEAKDYNGGTHSPAKDSKGEFASDAKPEQDFYDADSKQDDSHCNPSLGNKQDAKVEEPLTDDEILEKLQRFFFEDERFGRRLEEFVQSKCDIFDLETDEYKLQYTSLYEEYKTVFENMLENFIASDLKCSINDVYRALKTADEKAIENPNSLDAFFAQVLIASTDFEVFMTMLKDAARQQKRK